MKSDSAAGKSSQLSLRPATVTTMSLSHAGQVLVAGDLGGRLTVWSAAVSDMIPPLASVPWCCEFAPRGGIFAVGESETLIRLYGTRSASQQRCLVKHSAAVTGLGFHQNCALVGSIGLDAAVRICDLREAATARLFIGAEKGLPPSHSPQMGNSSRSSTGRPWSSPTVAMAGRYCGRSPC